MLKHFTKFGLKEDDFIVWIAEDATALIERIEFMSRSNQLVGLVPQLDPHTGLPLTNQFNMDTMTDVNYMMKKNEKAKYVYAIVAVTLFDSVPPYILCVYATDQKFTSDDVLSR